MAFFMISCHTILTEPISHCHETFFNISFNSLPILNKLLHSPRYSTVIHRFSIARFRVLVLKIFNFCFNYCDPNEQYRIKHNTKMNIFLVLNKNHRKYQFTYGIFRHVSYAIFNQCTKSNLKSILLDPFRNFLQIASHQMFIQSLFVGKTSKPNRFANESSTTHVYFSLTFIVRFMLLVAFIRFHCKYICNTFRF